MTVFQPRDNPFPGLRPFEKEDYKLFFGREGQSEEVLRRLCETRFLAVVGTSGSGKSSLIRAGLLPDLEGGWLAGAGSHWSIAIFRPGGDPIGNLSRALNKPDILQREAPEKGEEARSDLLLEVTLRRSGLGLIEAMRLARLPEDQNLLVVVDQFEELFRFASAAGPAAQADDAAAFVKLLLEATRQRELPIYVVITMRSDFIGDCARFQELPETVTAGMYLIPRMTRAQRRKAIEGPVGVGSGSIAPRLVNRLLNEVGDNPDQLPILQHAMMRTWDHWANWKRALPSSDTTPIDFADYEAIGGLENALSKHADEAYSALGSEQHQEIARRMFQSLTEKGADNREIRRPTTVGNIAAVAHASTDEVVGVIEEFRKPGRSFLNTPEKGELTSKSLIDISHESLIRLWSPRLKDWVNEESESARIYRRLADASERHDRGEADVRRGLELQNYLAWRERERPTAEWAARYAPNFERVMAYLEESRKVRDAEEAEKERERREREAEKELRRREQLRRARTNLAVVSVLAVLALVAAGYGWIQKGVAQRHEIEAKKAKDDALRARDDAEKNARIAHDAQLVAEASGEAARKAEVEAVKNERRAETNEKLAEQAERERHLESLHGRQLRVSSDASEAYFLDQLILQLSPTKAAYWHIWKATVLMRQGKLDEGKACDPEATHFNSAKCEADAAVRAAPDSYEARTTRGYLYMLMGQPGEAIKDFEYVQKNIPLPLPLNSLNLAIAQAALGRAKEALETLDHAMEDTRNGDNQGGTEELVPKEITDRTGRTDVVASPEAFLAALYYLRSDFESYTGSKNFGETLRRADREVAKLQVRPTDEQDACLVAITWAWLQGKARPGDYGMFAAQGAMWERAGYPDQAVKSYEKFEKAQAQSRDARYTELARWEQGARAGAQKAAASLPHREAAVAPTDLALEKGLQSQILQARGSLPEAESLVNEAIALDPRTVRLYLQRAQIYFVMAGEARETGDQLRVKALVLASQLKKSEPKSDAATKQPGAGAAEQAKQQALEAEIDKTEQEAKSYQAKANALYGKVIADCNRVMTQLPRAAEAYVYRAYASFFQRGGPRPPLESDDPILKDLREALAIRQDRYAMDTLIYLLTGPDVSKLSENDPRLEEALRLGLERDRMFPGDAGNLATLAKLQYSKKQYFDADKSIEAAIRLEGNNYEYYETRAKIEEAMGKNQLQVQRQLARGYRRAADIFRWNEKSESAETASEKSWEPMKEIAKIENNAEILCNPEITVCTENRVVAVTSDWILGAVESVAGGKGKTREVQIDRGSEDGIILLTKGEVYSLGPEDEDGDREVKKIGTGQVESVEGRWAMVRVTLEDPTGDGMVRQHDLFYLKARMPKGAERSQLWGLARFHIALVDQNRKTLLDYRTLYSQESPEVENQIFAAMLEDVHGDAKPGRKLMQETMVGNRFAGKTMQQALAETTRADLEPFLKFVYDNRADYFGRESKLTEIYEAWLLYGPRREWADCGIESVESGEGKSRQARIGRGSEDGVVLGARGGVFSIYSKEGEHERDAARIGTGEVVSVGPRSAMVQITLKSASGDGLVRPHDTLLIKVRVPEGPAVSTLWRLARYDITLQNVGRKTILDYRTLYGRETAELDNKLYEQMLDDIHEAAKRDVDFLKEKPEKGKFAGKTLGTALGETTHDDLERFFQFVLKFPGKYFGHEYRIVDIYATWVLNGTRDE